MKRTTHLARFFIVVLGAIGSMCTNAQTADIDAELAKLAHDLDVAKYDTPDGDPRAKAFDAIRQRAVNLEKQYPRRAEPMVWEAWALCEHAGVLQNFSALGLLKQARKKIEAAIAIDPNVYGADTYATLGALYYNMPGFPLGFGDKKKGRAYVQQALAIDSVGAQQNLNYASILFKDDDYARALKFATTALHAPPRPGREKADADLHKRAETRIAEAKEKLR